MASRFCPNPLFKGSVQRRKRSHHLPHDLYCWMHTRCRALAVSTRPGVYHPKRQTGACAAPFLSSLCLADGWCCRLCPRLPSVLLSATLPSPLLHDRALQCPTAAAARACVAHLLIHAQLLNLKCPPSLSDVRPTDRLHLAAPPLLLLSRWPLRGWWIGGHRCKGGPPPWHACLGRTKFCRRA